MELEAVLTILVLSVQGLHTIVASGVVDDEISQIPDDERQQAAAFLADLARERIALNDDIEHRANLLQTAGFPVYDALHLACAESAAVDVFLTTDDRLLRRAARGLGSLAVRVRDPLQWLSEVQP
jgi:predicted nucleic acid-binding protein